jgi:TolA-binding protein
MDGTRIFQSKMPPEHCRRRHVRQALKAKWLPFSICSGEAIEAILERNERGDLTMGVRKLFLVTVILAASTMGVAAVKLVNPHDVLKRSQREGIEFDKRMERYRAEREKEQKEREAKQKIEEAERQKREQAEKTLQEAQRKLEAAEQRKRDKEAKALQDAQKKRDAAAAKAAKGAPPLSATTTPPQPSTGVSETNSPVSQP